MTKAKNKLCERGAQEFPEWVIRNEWGEFLDIDPLTFEEWAQRSAEELAACANGGGELLFKLARVPPACRKPFLADAGRALGVAYIGHKASIRRTSETVPKAAIFEFEKALRKAYSAFQTIPEEWRTLFHFFELKPNDKFDRETIKANLLREEPWESIFERMVRRCAEYTGVDPRVTKRGRGRQKKQSTQATYPLKALLWKLERIIKRHGGNLTFNRTKRSGTWINALNGLWPLFPEGFIPQVPPLSMLETIKRKANSIPI